MKKLAYLIMVHKINEQLYQLIQQFPDDGVDIFIHLDEKCQDKLLILKPNIHLIDKRINVKWGHISVLEAQLELIKVAKNHGDYSHYIFLSGQDLVLKNFSTIKNFYEYNVKYSFIHLEENTKWRNKQKVRYQLKYPKWMFSRSLPIRLIRKMYQVIFGIFLKDNPAIHFGSMWMSLTDEFVEYLLKYDEEYQIIEKNKHFTVPDEFVIHTIFMNSPFKEYRKDYLTYVDWSENKPSPKVLTMIDLPYLLTTPMFYARKFDENIDAMIIARIIENAKE